MVLPARPFQMLACVLLALALAACSKATDQTAAKAAGAPVLPGTISDAMLNLDQSRSQPLLQPAPTAKDVTSVTATDEPSDAAVDAPSKPDAIAPAN